MEIYGYVIIVILLLANLVSGFENNHLSGCGYLHQAEEDALKTLFGPQSTYNKLAQPKGQRNANVSLFGEPVVVSVNLLIRQIGEINDRKREFTASMTLRQNWNDNRLRFTPSDDSLQYIVLTDVSRIWVPDLFFSNDKSGHVHNLLAPNILIRITPNGDVLYSSRISATFHCPMDFSTYPMDKQICSIRMASYAHTTSELMPIWKTENALQVARGLDPQPFKVLVLGTDYCHTKTLTGKYGCLLVEVLLERTTPLMHTYVPLALLVMVSWFTFWLDKHNMTVRILVSLIILLATIAEGSRVSSQAPPAGNTRAIDSWFKWSLAFVFIALMQQILVIAVPKIKNKKNKEVPTNNMIAMVEQGDGTDKTADIQPSQHTCPRHNKSHPSVDKIARVVFPLAYLVFNIVYWLTLRNQIPQLSVENLIKYV